MWLNYIIISGSLFLGMEMNGKSCMGFCFCAGLSLFIYMSGEGLVESGILIESCKHCVVLSGHVRIKFSIGGNHVKPELGLGHPNM